ncbi:MAG: FAD-binding oxidoreductase, partial [Verrucomicrobiota bacterium]
METEIIARELRALIGNDAVISTPEELLVYECDAYTLEKFLPNVVVLPRTTAEVVAAVKFCAEHKLAIIPRGAGTSLSGTVLAVGGGVMIGLARMNKVLNVDVRN